MDEEISRQEEARKILDSIRHKETEGEKEEPRRTFSQLPNEDAHQLQALVAQKLGIKPPDEIEAEAPPELPDPESIDPISTEQVKVMRKFATVKVDEKKPFRVALIDSIIKAYFSVADSFKLSSPSTRHCFTNGHECLHCGKKIPFALVENHEKSGQVKKKATAPPSA